jgi:Flp pilus assembly protein TadG
MKKRRLSLSLNQKGAVLIKFVLFLPVLIGMAAMSIDVVRLAVAKNELQNAADAGALAAARFLYNNSGTAVNTGANQIGYDAATANRSENLSVEVNGGDVQRGHWSFGMGALPRGFTPNSSTAPVNLSNVTETDLDADPSFINAVRVTTRREAMPIFSYFANIFGINSWPLNASAVAYIGYAGDLEQGEVDLPISICSQAVTDDLYATECGVSDYECNIGRMLTDGEIKNSAAWTNFSQPCSTASTTSMRPLLTCENANGAPISLGKYMGATNGVVDSLINHPNQPSLIDCWVKSSVNFLDGRPTEPWNVTLPVVNCPGTAVSNCLETCGAVNVNIVWILEKENGIDADAPKKMFNPLTGQYWQNYNANGITRWDSFVLEFGIEDVYGAPATYANGGYKKKSIYFLPSCDKHPPAGKTGGKNFGILAKIPLLVK